MTTHHLSQVNYFHSNLSTTLFPRQSQNEAAGICPVTTHVLQTPDDLFVDLLILWQEITGDNALLDEINLDFSL